MREEIKYKIFNAACDLKRLKEFEEWLYQSDELKKAINDEFVMELFSFNYNQKDALYEFRNFVFTVYSDSEFDYFFVQNECYKIVNQFDEIDNLEIILDELYVLGLRNQGVVFQLGMKYCLFESWNEDKEKTIIEIKDLAEDILASMEDFEAVHVVLDLDEFEDFYNLKSPQKVEYLPKETKSYNGIKLLIYVIISIIYILIKLN